MSQPCIHDFTEVKINILNGKKDERPFEYFLDKYYLEDDDLETGYELANIPDVFCCRKCQLLEVRTNDQLIHIPQNWKLYEENPYHYLREEEELEEYIDIPSRSCPRCKKEKTFTLSYGEPSIVYDFHTKRKMCVTNIEDIRSVRYCQNCNDLIEITEE